MSDYEAACEIREQIKDSATHVCSKIEYSAAELSLANAAATLAAARAIVLAIQSHSYAAEHNKDDWNAAHAGFAEAFEILNKTAAKLSE